MKKLKTKNILLSLVFAILSFSLFGGGAVCIYQNAEGEVICTTYGNSSIGSEQDCAESARASNPTCGLLVGAINVAAGSCASAIFGSPNRCLDDVAPHNITASVTQVACESAGDRWCPSTYYGFFVGNSGCQDAICAAAQEVILLPIELISFKGEISGNGNRLNWVTESEYNNDYFQLDYSTDGVNWNILVRVSGAGNSNEEKDYNIIHTNPDLVVNYYRLSQVDYNGEIETFNTISIDNRIKKPNVISIVDIVGQKINENYKGIIIICYDDGTFKRTYR